MRIPLIIVFIFYIFLSLLFAIESKVFIRVLPAPPFLTMDLDFKEPSDNNILDAEESGELIVTIKNNGEGDAFDTILTIEGEKIEGLNIEQNVNVGKIAKGETKRITVPLVSNENLVSKKVMLTVKLTELNGFNPKPVSISFNTKSFDPPNLKIVDYKIIDSNRNQKIEPMEMVEIKTRIQNLGEGVAKDVKIKLNLGKNVFLGGKLIDNFQLGDLKSGEFKDISFVIYANSLIPDKSLLPVSLDITEKKGKFGLKFDLKLVIHNPDNIQEIKTVEGKIESNIQKVSIAKGLSSELLNDLPANLKKADKDDIAIIIGNRNYKKLTPVEFAINDASAVKYYLINLLGYREGNIIYLEDATLSDFNATFGNKMRNYIKQGKSNLFVYYAGHGAPNPDTNEAYFVPVDADVHYISSTGYKLQDFYDNLAKSGAKSITIVLDACFSGLTPNNELLFKNVSPAILKVKEQYRKPSTATIFASSSFKEVSTWYPEKEHSLFTYHFLKGLKGDADLNRDKVITVEEMAKYLKEETNYLARRLHNIDQNPVIDGNLTEVLVKLK